VKIIKEVLEKIYNDQEMRNSCIPLFIGNPGLGKSILIHEFAKEKGVNVVEMIGSTLMPHEISGIAIPSQETKMMTYFDYDRLLTMNDGDILFLDELLNTNPMVLNAFLTLLTTRKMISGKPLPKVMIVAAANNQGASMLTPQIKERFIFYDVNFDASMWSRYMYKKYNVIDEVMTELVSLIQNETFLSSSRNYYSPRSVDKAVNMIINEVPTPYESKLNPILNKLVTNTTGEPIEYSDKRQWMPDEKISWLKLKRKIKTEEQ
jgi:MoxR-like ATPase